LEEEMIMLQTRELLVTKGTKRRSGAKLKAVAGVTIHNTGNNSKGANADANARYQKNSANEAVNGWHWTVDEKEAIQSIPNDEIAEHSGTRKGNDTTVAIEICDNVDGNLLMATNNGAELAAFILTAQGHESAVWKQNIYQHNDWSGKDCPSEIRHNKPYNWLTFLEHVNSYMEGGMNYVTIRTAEIYRRDSDRKTIGAGNEVELLEYSGGKWALVRNPKTGNEFIVEWAALGQKG
jgi:N-acetylmuramoyl-L-alanine amidase